MISYELAKELKDAGFPRGGEGKSKVQSPGCPHWGTDGYQPFSCECWIYFPTLSELIEACGVEFYRLHRIGQEIFTCDDVQGRHECVGATPEEAVAKLWLALNKKV